MENQPSRNYDYKYDCLQEEALDVPRGNSANSGKGSVRKRNFSLFKRLPLLQYFRCRFGKSCCLQWTSGLFVVSLLLYAVVFWKRPGPISVRPMTKPNHIFIPDVLDIDVPMETCPVFQNIKGDEEAQMTVFWGKLFGDKARRSLTEIAMSFEDNWFTTLESTYKSRSDRFLSKEPSIGNYQYQISPLNHNGTHLCLRINETLNGNRTEGGSSFQLTVRGPSTVDAVRSVDHFDGTYSLCAKYYELQHSVVLILYFAHFGAYMHQRGDLQDRSRRLLSSNIKLSPTDKVTIISVQDFKPIIDTSKIGGLGDDVAQSHAYSILPEDSYQLSLLNVATDALRERYVRSHEVCHVLDESQWVVYKGRWRLKYRGHVVARPHPARLSDCLNQYDSVTLVGDSHLRFIFYYLMTFVTGPDKRWGVKEHQDLRGGHFMYWWRPKGRDFLDYLSELRSSLMDNSWAGYSFPKKGNRGHIIIMGIGHHDVEAKQGSGLFLSNMRKVLRALVDIVQLCKARKIELIWLTHPELQWKHTVVSCTRNNYLLAALNQWVVPRILMLGIKVFDTFDLTMVINDQDVCYGHYICIRPDNHTVSGDPGQATADLLFTQMCPP